MRPSVRCPSSRHWWRKPCRRSEHLVDAAYISAALLVESQDQQGITLRGPTRPTQGWQAQVDGGYTIEQFEVDWAQQRVRCPQGKWSVAWWDQGDRARSRPIFVEFALEDCQACPARALCTRAQQQGRRVGLPPQDQYEALRAAQTWYGSEEGQQGYKRRAGVEGTLSQGVRRLRAAVRQVPGARENPLAACRDRRSHQCRSDCGLAGGAATGEDADLSLRRARSRLRPTRWDTT